MLTPLEKVIFAVAVAGSLAYAWIGFRAVYRVIRRGQGDFPAWRSMGKRAADAKKTQ